MLHNAMHICGYSLCLCAATITHTQTALTALAAIFNAQYQARNAVGEASRMSKYRKHMALYRTSGQKMVHGRTSPAPQPPHPLPRLTMPQGLRLVRPRAGSCTKNSHGWPSPCPTPGHTTAANAR